LQATKRINSRLKLTADIDRKRDLTIVITCSIAPHLNYDRAVKSSTSIKISAISRGVLQRNARITCDSMRTLKDLVDAWRAINCHGL